jgi:F-type H+-transporting ATPase subunit gamma
LASLKDMRNRIGSVKATQKITKAMQMVAAAKLKRAQDAAENARPYAERMSAVISNLAAGVSGDAAPKLLAGTGSDQRHLIIVSTSDRGLCGGFNTAIVRAAREHINGLLASGKSVKIICVGRKGRDQLKRLYADRIIADFDMSGTKVLTLDAIKPIADLALSQFEDGHFDVVSLFYSQFKSVISQVPAKRALIPAEVKPVVAKAGAGDAIYEYEPDEEGILEALLPRNLSVQILSAMLENNAGFYAAQMSAMDNATRNAGDMINALNLQYNRKRQAQITTELIEIIAGAEAV